MLKKTNVLMPSIAVLIVLCCCVAGCGKRVMLGGGGYNHNFARYGEYNLVSKNSDLYMDRVNGKDSRRLTFSPKVKEDFAFVLGNTGYVVYSVIEDISKPKKYYIQNMDTSYKTRKKITEQEFNKYLRER
ncbi:MAG: hypothetical protein ABII88_04400 [Candidatus Omnitrophota bacterium]